MSFLELNNFLGLTLYYQSFKTRIHVSSFDNLLRVLSRLKLLAKITTRLVLEVGD